MSIFSSHVVLTGRSNLFVVCRLLIVGVSVLLAHGHCGWRLVLSRVAAVLRLLGVLRVCSRMLGRLHHWSRLWSRVLLRVLMLLARRIRRHLRVGGALRRWHLLLIAITSRIAVCQFFHARTARWCQRRVTSVGDGAGTVIQRGIRRLAVVVGRCCSSSAVVASTLLIVLVPFLGRFVLAAAHPHVATDTDTTALLGDLAAQGSALRQPGELLGGEDGKRRRLDLSTMADELVAVVYDHGVTRIHVLDLGSVLKQCEAQAVFALVTDGQVREEEVAAWHRAFEVGHAGNWGTSEDRKAGACGRLCASVCDGARILQSRMEEETGIVGTGNVDVVLEDLDLNNWGRINRATIRARLCAATTGTRAFGLLNY